jgi:hypothetical protein
MYGAALKKQIIAIAVSIHITLTHSMKYLSISCGIDGGSWSVVVVGSVSGSVDGSVTGLMIECLGGKMASVGSL